MTTYTIEYWPGIPGRLLPLQCLAAAAGISLTLNRDPSSVVGWIRGTRDTQLTVDPAFAPPVLLVSDTRKGTTKAIPQSPVALQHLAQAHNFAVPEPLAETGWCVLLTLFDIVDGVHNLHHPISSMLTYEQQKDAAVQASSFFGPRLRRVYALVEKHRQQNGSAVAVLGPKPSVIDIVLFWMVAGLDYAYPRQQAVLRSEFPGLFALNDSLLERLPALRDFWTSDQRDAFCTNGIFRHYPELDESMVTGPPEGGQY